MRIVIAGCRDYCNYDEAKKYIDICLSTLEEKDDIIIVSGCANGADSIGEIYAREKGYSVEKYPPDWKRYGKGAGLIRNKKMVDICDRIICFWDGKSRGTRSTIEYANICNKPVEIINISKRKPPSK